MKFQKIVARWKRQNLMVLLFTLALEAFFIISAYLFGESITSLVIFAVFLVFLSSIRPFFKENKRINNIISIINLDEKLNMGTFAFPSLFGMVKNDAIHQIVSKSDVFISEVDDKWPLNQKILQSRNNYSLEILGKKYFLIRDLFDDKNIFNEVVNSFKK